LADHDKMSVKQGCIRKVKVPDICTSFVLVGRA
jgi:hypothetical protein